MTGPLGVYITGAGRAFVWWICLKLLVHKTTEELYINALLRTPWFCIISSSILCMHAATRFRQIQPTLAWDHPKNKVKGHLKDPRKVVQARTFNLFYACLMTSHYRSRDFRCQKNFWANSNPPFRKYQTFWKAVKSRQWLHLIRFVQPKEGTSIFPHSLRRKHTLARHS